MAGSEGVDGVIVSRRLDNRCAKASLRTFSFASCSLTFFSFFPSRSFFSRLSFLLADSSSFLLVQF